MAGEDDIQRIAAEVARYMAEHPNASDTLEGITRWWLQGHIEHQLASVEAAVRTLVASGVVEERSNRSGRKIYVLSGEGEPPPASQRSLRGHAPAEDAADSHRDKRPDDEEEAP